MNINSISTSTQLVCACWILTIQARTGRDRFEAVIGTKSPLKPPVVLRESNTTMHLNMNGALHPQETLKHSLDPPIRPSLLSSRLLHNLAPAFRPTNQNDPGQICEWNGGMSTQQNQMLKRKLEIQRRAAVGSGFFLRRLRIHVASNTCHENIFVVWAQHLLKNILVVWMQCVF